MALVTTTVTPPARVQPFTGISEIQRERSGIARAEVIYSTTGTWPATGAGDSRGLIITFDLDPDFGHVLMDCNSCFIASADYLEMEASSWMEIETSTPGDLERQYYPLVNYASRQGNSAGNTPVGDIPANNYNSTYPAGTEIGSMVFSMEVTPTGLLWPFPGVGYISCSTVFGEQALQQPGYSYRFFCRFLQYDITQGYNYVVNSPVMTR